jgi:hypothetical protein
MHNSELSIRMKVLCWLPALCWAGLIFMLSHRPLPEQAVWPDIPGMDKLAHAAVYGVLSVLLYFGLDRAHRMRRSTALVIAALMASLYGVLDEFHQSFVPGRSVEYADWLADTLGAVFFMFFPLLKKCMQPFSFLKGKGRGNRHG